MFVPKRLLLFFNMISFIYGQLNECAESEYQCSDTGSCISKSWLCDGVQDCDNNEDEDLGICPTNAPTPAPTDNPTSISNPSSCHNGGEEILILRLKNVNNGYFSSSIRSTGVENSENVDDNTYSIIGNVDEIDYMNMNNGEYEFKLVYTFPNATLQWVQTSWLTDSSWLNNDKCCNYAPGFRAINFDPPQDPTIGKDDKFYGLGPSNNDECYLDGTSLASDWFNCVGPTTDWNQGIAGYNRQSHKAQSLYVCKPPLVSSLQHHRVLTGLAATDIDGGDNGNEEKEHILDKLNEYSGILSLVAIIGVVFIFGILLIQMCCTLCCKSKDYNNGSDSVPDRV